MEGRSERAVRALGRGGARRATLSLAEEAEVAVVLNGRLAARLSASPLALEELALGHLALLGRVRTARDVRAAEVRRARGGWEVRVEARHRAPRAPRPSLPAGPRMAPAKLRTLMRALLDGAALYRGGGGVHTGALATPDGIALLAEDVGKVNTLDRLAGQALLRGQPTRGMVLLTTGRLTGAMVHKALAMGCPLLASHSGPTTAGADAAARAGATLVGYVRGASMQVVCGPRRVG